MINHRVPGRNGYGRREGGDGRDSDPDLGQSGSDEAEKQEFQFRPTIPVAIRRDEHLADGEAEARQDVGLNGFATRYVTVISMADGHAPAELLEDQACEMVLGTGHALTGHFYPSEYVSPGRSVFVFIPMQG